MICINCFHDKTNIINSRSSKKHPETWRRHRCPKCQTSFSTYEKPGEAIKINNETGGVTLFNLGKLVLSISKSFQHNKYSAEFDSLFIAQTIESKLLKLKRGGKLTTKDIRITAYDTIKSFDSLAAMQYAAQHNLVSSVKKPGRPSTIYHAQ